MKLRSLLHLAAAYRGALVALVLLSILSSLVMLFVPWLAGVALPVFLLGQGLRIAAMRALGSRWTVKVLTLGWATADGRGDKMPRDAMGKLLIDLGAAIPAFYSAVTPINTVIFAWTRNLGVYRFTQLLLILFLPFMLMMILGGF